MSDYDRREPLVFLEQFGKVVGYGLINAPYVTFVERDPHERRGEGLSHGEGGLYRTLIVAIEVPLVEQLIVVDDEERRRPARIEVVFEAAVATVARDGLDLEGVRVVRGQLIEAEARGRVVDRASGELFEVLVV